MTSLHHAGPGPDPQPPRYPRDLLGYGRDPRAPLLDAITTDGDVEVPIDAAGFGFWLKAAFGAPTTAGTVAATGAITFNVRKSGASLAASAYSTGTTTVATLANATTVELGWYYDGGGTVFVYVNEKCVCTVDVGNSTGLVVATFPQATALGAGFGCKAAATAPTTADMIVDFMLAAQTRDY